LLPARLPDIAGVELAARYVPGHRTGVGGDWYDVFTLPSGVIGIVVGDVSGHGLAAAVVMGRLRSALRAYALECDDPADALTRLDHKIRHFETGNLATALYAMIDPGRDRLRISLAGHLPPILASPGKPAESLALPVDLPLGTGHEQPRHTTEVALDEGAVIVAYTDGLVERRDESIDIGMQRLIESIEPAPAEVLCAAIMADLGAALPTDDIALLTLRRHTGS
jgi:serine phosphatase RsbU (regulator of sigma subunit)